MPPAWIWGGLPLGGLNDIDYLLKDASISVFHFRIKNGGELTTWSGYLQFQSRSFDVLRKGFCRGRCQQELLPPSQKTESILTISKRNLFKVLKAIFWELYFQWSLWSPNFKYTFWQVLKFPYEYVRACGKWQTTSWWTKNWAIFGENSCCLLSEGISIKSQAIHFLRVGERSFSCMIC